MMDKLAHLELLTRILTALLSMTFSDTVQINRLKNHQGQIQWHNNKQLMLHLLDS
jgi:hypothetical protein